MRKPDSANDVPRAAQAERCARLAGAWREQEADAAEKMATCNKEAGDKKLEGDARKKFMSDCLSADKPTQQEKMTTCNKQAGEKKLAGDERKKFMSSCLSG